MRPEFEKIQPKSSHSFMARVVKRDKRPLLSQAWHYHPEIEICYTARSQGLKYVGNGIFPYKERDLVVLGSNLPHGFTTVKKSEQFVIQFNQEFLGRDFFNVVELERIKDLLHMSRSGLVLKGAELEKAEDLIYQIYNAENTGMEQLLLLLQFLDYLSKCSNLVSLCSEKYTSSISVKKLNDIKAIFDYIENNFQKDITIQSASRVVNLTESAFYKFIKRHTNKKFTVILNEFRIDHSSKLLVSSDLPISEISFKSGYNNLSYFNRIFKQSYNMTPRQFRKKYRRNERKQDSEHRYHQV